MRSRVDQWSTRWFRLTSQWFVDEKWEVMEIGAFQGLWAHLLPLHLLLRCRLGRSTPNVGHHASTVACPHLAWKMRTKIHVGALFICAHCCENMGTFLCSGWGEPQRMRVTKCKIIGQKKSPWVESVSPLLLSLFLVLFMGLLMWCLLQPIRVLAYKLGHIWMVKI